jgi:hypothetical protein
VEKHHAGCEENLLTPDQEPLVEETLDAVGSHRPCPLRGSPDILYPFLQDFILSISIILRNFSNPPLWTLTPRSDCYQVIGKHKNEV